MSKPSLPRDAIGEIFSVYRNLKYIERGANNYVYSLKGEYNKVQYHDKNFLLRDVKLKISNPGRELCRKTKQRTVHGMVVGNLAVTGMLFETREFFWREGVRISYNPFVDEFFTSSKHHLVTDAELKSYRGNFQYAACLEEGVYLFNNFTYRSTEIILYNEINRNAKFSFSLARNLLQ